MKSFVKYIMSVLVFGLCLISCSEDPNVPIHSELDFTKCLRPVNFKCNVQYVDVTVDFKAFPDAEAYELEAYSTDFQKVSIKKGACSEGFSVKITHLSILINISELSKSFDTEVCSFNSLEITGKHVI